MTENIVIVGAGQSAASLVARLRKNGYEHSITLIGDEALLPYQRPPLSKKYLSGEMPLEKLLIKASDWYAENNVSVITDTQCVGIDREEKQVSLDNGTAFPYDKLVLATGSSPITLPAAMGGGLDGVYTMRSIADADAMADEFVAGKEVLIVGGGYIGLEAAAVAASKGLKVTLVEMADRILGRVASAETADWFRNLHQQHGVDVREGVALTRLQNEGDRVKGAVLSDGSEVTADFVIVGIGIRPNTELAESAGLAVENGIAVDAHCCTSDADIYAAGDCASFDYEGNRIRLESVQNASDMADVAADNLLGVARQYKPLARFWSDQYDAKLQIIGLCTGYDKVVTRAGKKPGSLSVWYYRGDQLIAVDAMGDPISYVMAMKALDKGIQIPAENIADAGFDVGQYIKSQS